MSSPLNVRPLVSSCISPTENVSSTNNSPRHSQSQLHVQLPPQQHSISLTSSRPSDDFILATSSLSPPATNSVLLSGSTSSKPPHSRGPSLNTILSVPDGFFRCKYCDKLLPNPESDEHYNPKYRPAPPLPIANILPGARTPHSPRSPAAPNRVNQFNNNSSSPPSPRLLANSANLMSPSASSRSPASAASTLRYSAAATSVPTAASLLISAPAFSRRPSLMPSLLLPLPCASYSYCPNGCLSLLFDTEGLSYKKRYCVTILMDNEEHDCMNEKVFCSFCNGRLPRRDIERHLREEAEERVQEFNCRFLAAEKEKEKLKTELKALQDKLHVYEGKKGNESCVANNTSGEEKLASSSSSSSSEKKLTKLKNTENDEREQNACETKKRVREETPRTAQAQHPPPANPHSSSTTGVPGGDYSMLKFSVTVTQPVVHTQHSNQMIVEEPAK